MNASNAEGTGLQTVRRLSSKSLIVSILLAPQVTGRFPIRHFLMSGDPLSQNPFRLPILMKFSHLLLLSALWLGGPARSTAGEETSTATHVIPLPEALKPCDLDGDGKISVEERQAYDDSVREATQQKVFAGKLLWDTNGDGTVSDEERQAATEGIRQKIEASRSARFDELDKNEDGKLSAAEFLNVPNIKARTAARILSHLDSDRDGFISKSEFLIALTPGPVNVTPATLKGLTLAPGPAAPATINPTTGSIGTPSTTPPSSGTATSTSTGLKKGGK